MTRKQKQIQQHRGEIKEMASRIKMRYEQNREQDVDIGTKWIDIAPNVQSIRCSLSGKNCTVINVRFGEGGRIQRHEHPLRREDIYVIDGEIRDTVNNVVVKQGDHYVIPAGLPHEIVSDYALLTITFRPAYPEIELQD